MADELFLADGQTSGQSLLAALRMRRNTKWEYQSVGTDDYYGNVTGQRLILYDKGMEGKETSSYTPSGQSPTRTSRGTQTEVETDYRPMQRRGDKTYAAGSFRLRGNYANKTICP